MVAILEEIKLVTKQRVEQLKTPFNEIHNDCTLEKNYRFKMSYQIT